MAELLYHGSITKVEHIDLSFANPKRDFGAGFYATTSLDQAIRFSQIIARRNESSKGIVSKYQYLDSGNLEVYKFTDSNLEWLDFVLSNRGYAVDEAATQRADLIIGPVANDQVGQTLNLLMTGAYGDPLSPAAKNFAISLLLTQKLVDQWVFKASKAVSCLKFIGAEEYDL